MELHTNRVFDVILQVDTETGLFSTGLVKNIDISEVCILDYENNDFIPFTDLCENMGTREDEINYRKLSKVTNRDNDQLIARWKNFNRSLTSGEESWLLPVVTLQLSDGSLYTVYPHSFGYALNRNTPFAFVNMQRSIIEVNIDRRTLSKVLDIIIDVSWPSIRDIEENLYLVEDLLYIANALNFLWFDFFPEFYQKLSEACKLKLINFRTINSLTEAATTF